MLVAREQLRFVENLIAQFSARPFAMQPLTMYQSQYVAVVAMLRSVGHVFYKVDCDNHEKKKWADAQWSGWTKEAVFHGFIEPARNKLLKEFSGGLSLQTDGMGSPAFVSGLPGDSSVVVDFDAKLCRDSEGRLVLPLFREAVSFWDKVLRTAEAEWKVQ